mmetsp:Transcript_39344/g.93123  ORF Transcript_39344/g.93123 Transcript_39344/m.93123 type:complete len:280 (+) Transcript_39344:149-988(+)|eukprot:CAMPEP_0180132976 /NCGR_PEP_ID=MMETSP0986-20121125/9287_1 /TAXON_ID=697907 /ORGANISM="non described non described, Strain CCMP2293" /LENGTH=279 /DNA_ID=CAMNT_0022073049 /DNA_START=135 /DNA_END=974 /DNA_ORIENTATION=+
MGCGTSSLNAVQPVGNTPQAQPASALGGGALAQHAHQEPAQRGKEVDGDHITPFDQPPDEDAEGGKKSLESTALSDSTACSRMSTPVAESASAVSPSFSPSALQQAPSDAASADKAPADSENIPTAFWEKQVLPARPGTASRTRAANNGKLVVYKTDKQKKTEEAARKKRDAGGGKDVTPEKAKKAAKSALPPLKERKRRSKAPDSELVLAPSHRPEGLDTIVDTFDAPAVPKAAAADSSMDSAQALSMMMLDAVCPPAPLDAIDAMEALPGAPEVDAV